MEERVTMAAINDFNERHYPAGTMSYPAIEEFETTDGPQASIYVCSDPECQEAAAEWVRTYTGHRGVFSPFGSSRQPLYESSGS